MTITSNAPAWTYSTRNMRHALATAQAISFEAPITAPCERLYAEGADHGPTDLDPSALSVELANRHGMR